MWRIGAFTAEECGAGAVDWVILTAASALLTLALMGQLTPLVEAAGLRLAERLAGLTIPTTFADWADLRHGSGDGSGFAPSPGPLPSQENRVETRH